ncbi:hypothetical protein [Kitasatospora sp. NPDC093806]|uniref:hypothetical protein n=1 Tax=Kitasatospora sp. NPDC093806 TaxID=3155075 RepID=UPI00342AE401
MPNHTHSAKRLLAGLALATAMTPFAGPAHADQSLTRELGTTADNLTNTCSFGQTGSTTTSNNAQAANPLVALVNGAINAVVPVDLNAQALDCNNIGVRDVVNLNAKNSDKKVDVTEVDDSFNHHG